MKNPLSLDLEYILNSTQGLWDEIKGQRIFITGGTGFIGCWLLESFAFANEKLNLGASTVVLTRNQGAFRKKAPHLAGNPAISFHKGDVRYFSFPEGEFSYVIHAATDAGAKLNEENPLLMFDTIVQGTRRVLDFARASGARKLLLTSSGAVYGKQPPHLTNVPEDYAGGPDPSDGRSAYGEGKRVAELLCNQYGRKYGIEAKIARCFAFVGPYLSLDIHYAIGNFIRNGLAGKPVHVTGDGTSYRSYLYAADLAMWLWTILIRGKPGTAYNVGSEEADVIADTAKIVTKAFSSELPVIIDKKADDQIIPERYLPSTKKARDELGLRQEIDLEDAIARTIRWHRQQLMKERHQRVN
ncbi:MAG TPA: NAD-dependent epimerase/dehydratase family protein [Syntrophales bacterium]|nr:NAD-dependent epimerase/dehydratase family protein [Syntrophales bacterium]